MKVTRRSDRAGGGHLLVSVPAHRVEELESALTFLEHTRQASGSQVILDLVRDAAKRNGWKRATPAPAERAAGHAQTDSVVAASELPG